MGLFSWKYCDSNNRMICGRRKDSFLLVPEEFGGGHIVEHCYNGYGRMSNVDVFEIVAEWNRKYISKDIIEVPDRTKWSDNEEGQKWYENAMYYYRKSCERLQDFMDGKPEDYMKVTYGSDWKRNIGINIACDDEMNAKLKYPVKIAENKESVYEINEVSKRDPLQGCY